MRPLADQNYYELLEVARDGTPQQVERAYRIARGTYVPSSAATYSVFSEEESGSILRRIEEAYAVLSDARLRQEYDARLQREERLQREARAARAPSLPEVAARPAHPIESAPPAPLRRTARAPAETELEIDGPLEPENGVYSGAVLRRIRLSLGIELDEIASITKVNERFLEAIEGDRFDGLPASVYVRGFLKEFAKCLGIDPSEVVASYMERHAGARGGTA